MLYNYSDDLIETKTAVFCILSGQVPLNYNNLGIYFRNFFNKKNEYFDKISSEHAFQTLTESNKPNNAFRTGLYITNIINRNANYYFKLLRCSSNFSGPTEQLTRTDCDILEQLNEKIAESFEQPVKLNHVLAQIYHNQNNKKASIKSHSDKTKDMPKNGIIAFCSFYKFDENHVESYKNISTMSSLHFKLKKDVLLNNANSKFVDEFSVILHPNSVFMIPLSTNRLYTHEIKPSCAPIQYLPTRMGYVIRCSNQDAVFSNGQTFIINETLNDKTKLEKPTAHEMEVIKSLYLKENTQSQYPDYSKLKHLSLNNGDFEQPIIRN